MKKIFTLFALVFLFAAEGSSQTITRVIGASPFQDSLWVFDTTNFNVVRRIAPFPSSGGSLTGTNSIAKNPLSGNLYVVCKQSATSGRILGMLNPLTGLVSVVGNTGDNFSSITFSSDGKLYGATGDGASVPETLYQLDTATAAKRLVKTMGNGADGEVICYNSTDNMIYHWSGNGTIVFEKMDTITGLYNFTNIPIIGTTNGETFGMLYKGGNAFLGSNISSRFQPWNSNGTVGAQIGATAPDDIRGLAYITCPRGITGNPAFCAGGSTTLTHSSSSSTSFQWYFNGAIIPGANSQTYAASQVGHYNCIVSDACGTDSSGTGFDVTTQNPLPVVTLSGSSAACTNMGTLLTGSFGGTSQWYMNGSLIVGANTNTYMATAAGEYNMTKTNLNGCTDSASAGITVTVYPTPVVDLGVDNHFCLFVTLDAGNPGASYQWSNGDTTEVSSFNVSGPIWVMVTDTNGCMNSDTMNATINPLPVVNLGPDTTVCGTSLTLDAGSAGILFYLWCDGSTTQTATFNSSGSCAVIVTDTNYCEGTDTINFVIAPYPVVTVTTADTSLCPADPAVTLVGSPAGGIYSGAGVSGNQFTAFNAGSGTHTVNYVYTDSNGCSASDSLQMLVYPVTLVNLSASDNTVCIDDADVTLTGSPAGGTYNGAGVSGSTFDPTVAGAGNHVVTYTFTDANSCNFAGATTIAVGLCAGIEEQVAANGFVIFPNPAGNEAQIILDAKSTVTVYNPIGESVMELQLNEGTHTLDLTALAAGVYFIRTENANGMNTQRLVIRK